MHTPAGLPCRPIEPLQGTLALAASIMQTCVMAESALSDPMEPLFLWSRSYVWPIVSRCLSLAAPQLTWVYANRPHCGLSQVNILLKSYNAIQAIKGMVPKGPPLCGPQLLDFSEGEV